MFTAALFIKAKIWKQPKCPSVSEWIKTLCIYTNKGLATSVAVTAQCCQLAASAPSPGWPDKAACNSVAA